jgi:uncharacterized membrane protein YdjX (TVP38/TMEM64 family)
MTQLSKLKIILGIIYMAIVALVVFLFFYYHIYSYVNADFIKNNRKDIFKFRDAHILSISIGFFLFCILWVFLLGFGSPLVILAGFIFGSIWGSIIFLIGGTVGATLLYIFVNNYFKELVFDYLGTRYKNLTDHFKNNDFSYLLFLRLVPGIPFQVTNLLPVLFNMKVKNYFFATIIGMAPSTIIMVSLISGISSKVEYGADLNFNLLSDPRISIPLAALGAMVLIVNFIKNKFFNNKN